MEFVLFLLLLAAVVAVIASPLRRGHDFDPALAAHIASLQAAKEAKYREIRDAELDFQTGKLSDADYQRLNRMLRAEAIELMRRLDAVREAAAEKQSRA
jgi:hypothetical protein